MQFEIMFQDDRRDAENQETRDGDDDASNYSVSQPINTRCQRSTGTSANTSAASSAMRVTDSTTIRNTNTATSNTGSIPRSGQPTGDCVG